MHITLFKDAVIARSAGWICGQTHVGTRYTTYFSLNVINPNEFLPKVYNS